MDKNLDLYFLTASCRQRKYLINFNNIILSVVFKNTYKNVDIFFLLFFLINKKTEL